MHTIAQLHSTWNRLTGQRLPLGVCSYELEYGWHQFIKAGFSELDLVAVIEYLQGEIRKGERKPAALRWSNCIGDTLRFAEELWLAREAKMRKKPVTAQAKALGTWRPTVAEVTPSDMKLTAVPVSQLIEDLRKAAGMRITP